MRRQIVIGEVDAPAIEELAVRRDGDEHRRVTVLGDADGSGLLRLASRHVLLLSDWRHCKRVLGVSVAAGWHGQERARLEALGKSAPFVDGQIAAIAQVNELVLVTANIKDFSQFRGLKVENWQRRSRHR